MADTYTVQMFYVGNYADMDTDETNWVNENPNVVLGEHDNLALTQVAEIDANSDGAIYDDEAGTNDGVRYDTGGGDVTTRLDSSSLYNADVLLGDGTTASMRVLVIQTTNGDVFISEYPAEPLDNLAIQSITLTSLNTSEAAGITAGASDVQGASVVCYALGTLIDTPDGPRPVESLRPDDMVLTLDRGPQPILWCRTSDQALDVTEDDARPVHIKTNAFAKNQPSRDLVISPQHRILMGGAGALGAAFEEEVFAPAKSLTALPGIRHMRGISRVTWVHFACARHEVVIANGCLSEALLIGPMVWAGLSSSERRALNDIYGEEWTQGAALNGAPARTCLTVGDARRKVTRFLKGSRGRLMCDICGWVNSAGGASCEEGWPDALYAAMPAHRITSFR